MLERRIETGDVRALVSDAAAAIGVSPGAAALEVYMRALAASDAAQFPPHLAVDFILEVRAISVAPWDRSFTVPAGRGGPEASGRLAMYRSAAAALSPLFECELLFERSALVCGTEQRLARLACDLHNGLLQEIVAFADDLRLARDEVVSPLDSSEGGRVRGRFAALEVRLASLDGALRDISHAVRSTTAIEQPLEHVLGKEMDVLAREAGMETERALHGDVSKLTESQKIALLRVVQESLSNARKHNNASRVRVRLRSATAYVYLRVSDDGRGSDAERTHSSERLGLVGVVERMRLLGGNVEIEKAPGGSVMVRATLSCWRSVENLTTCMGAVT